MQIRLDELNKKVFLSEPRLRNEDPERFVSYLQPEEKSSPAKERALKSEQDQPEEKTKTNKRDLSSEQSEEEVKKITSNVSCEDQTPKEEITHALKNHLQQQDIQLKPANLQAEQPKIALLNEELVTKALKTLQKEIDHPEPKVDLSALALQKMEAKPVNQKPVELLATENKSSEKNEPNTIKSLQPPANKDHSQPPDKREMTIEAKPDQRPRLLLEKEAPLLSTQHQSESATSQRVYFVSFAKASETQTLPSKILTDVQNAIQFLWQRGDDKIVIKLFPPELGRVQIELLRKEQGIEVRVSTENQNVRELILNNVDQLRQNLQNSGVQLRNFEVHIGNFRDFYLNYQQNQQNSDRREKTTLPDYGQFSQPEPLFSEQPEKDGKIILLTGRINILI